MAAAPNAVEERLATLAARWLAFTDESDATALRWLVASESVPMADAFVTVEAGEAGTLPDLFVRFEEPFAAGERYGAGLAARLAADIAEAEEAEAPGGDGAAPAPPWQPPPPHGDDALDFAAACASFAAHHAGVFDHVAVVLAPAAVDDEAAFGRWLHLVVRADLPRTVRLLLIDRADAPRYDALVAAEPQRVLSEPVDLDMAAAYVALAAAGNPADPGVQYRQHFVAMTGALGKGDARGGQRHADAALGVAAAQSGAPGWAAMEVAVHVALGSFALGAKALDDALACFRSARTAAERAAVAAEPASDALVVQTRMGEALALLSAERWAEAGVLYQGTAPLAVARGDATLALECWRMASYCFEQIGRGDFAWAAGLRAIETAEPMDMGARRATTLPYVGQGMLRVAETPDFRGGGPGVRASMATLLGPDWEDLLETPTPTPA